MAERDKAQIKVGAIVGAITFDSISDHFFVKMYFVPVPWFCNTRRYIFKPRCQFWCFLEGLVMEKFGVFRCQLVLLLQIMVNFKAISCTYLWIFRYIYSILVCCTWGRCYDQNFLRFCQFSAKKLCFSQKPML
jgi:hypothetical protein